MTLPFTPAQFFEVFATYHDRFAAVAVTMWVVTAVAVGLSSRQPVAHRRTVAVVLGLQWIWSGLAYHALLFTAINPAAWGFAALFLMQGALLVVRGTRVHWLEGRGLRRTVGLALTFYGFVYPLLNIAFGHPYPATPTFGVPCPTAIVTIGLLLTVRGGPPVSLSLIPLVWSVIRPEGWVAGSGSLSATSIGVEDSAVKPW